ncbi:MAG: restriction endonuclease [Verrucomicrobiales bacterium]|nr:restriction endonuclease [Verrucomicrobiales bacterium]
MNPFAASVSKLAPWLAGFFVLAAIRSLFRRIRVGWQFRNQKSINSLNDLSWKSFEDVCGEFFRKQGYHVEEMLGGGADGGVDLRLRKNGKLTLVQCKRWKSKKVGLPVVRELLGAMTAESVSNGIVVAASSFTADAATFARKQHIEVIDGSQLARGIGKLKAIKSAELAAVIPDEDSRDCPACPKCGNEMIRRTARKGKNVGNRFWGCSNFPRCRGLINQ